MCHIGLNSVVDTFTIYAEPDLLTHSSSQISDKLLSFTFRARTEISVEVCQDLIVFFIENVSHISEDYLLLESLSSIKNLVAPKNIVKFKGTEWPSCYTQEIWEEVTQIGSACDSSHLQQSDVNS